MHAEVARTLIREFAIKVRTSMACPIIQNFSHVALRKQLAIDIVILDIKLSVLE